MSSPFVKIYRVSRFSRPFIFPLNFFCSFWNGDGEGEGEREEIKNRVFGGGKGWVGGLVIGKLGKESFSLSLP